MPLWWTESRREYKYNTEVDVNINITRKMYIVCIQEILLHEELAEMTMRIEHRDFCLYLVLIFITRHQLLMLAIGMLFNSQVTVFKAWFSDIHLMIYHVHPLLFYFFLQHCLTKCWFLVLELSIFFLPPYYHFMIGCHSPCFEPDIHFMYSVYGISVYICQSRRLLYFSYSEFCSFYPR